MAATDITPPLVLLTGPTRGLGADVAVALARRRARLLLLGRDREGLRCIETDARNAGATEVKTFVVDMSSFASIRAAAHDVRADNTEHQRGPIGVVIANAGVQMSSRSTATTDGIETTFGVNVVANHLLLQELNSTLAAEAHVVVVGSGTHFGDPITRTMVAAPKWDDPKALATPLPKADDSLRAAQCAYSTSKLGVNYLVHELNRRWAEPMRANIYDPGLMPATGLARDLPPLKQWAWNHILPALKVLPGITSTSNSAERLVRLALGEEHPGARNAYIEIGKMSKASDASNDPARERALWDYCVQVGADR